MTRDQAQALVVRLLAAFPDYRADATAAIYIEHLQHLSDPDVAFDAVTALIDSETRLPTIAAIRDAYQRLKPPEPTQPEFDIPEDVRQENLKRIAEMTRRMADGMSFHDAAEDVLQ